MTTKRRTLAEFEKEHGKTIAAVPYLEKKFGPLTFARFLRMVRLELELTQVEMARKLNMAPGTLCDIEKGRQNVSPKLAVKICKLGKLPEGIAVRLALQDQLDRAKIKMKVELHSA